VIEGKPQFRVAEPNGTQRGERYKSGGFDAKHSDVDYRDYYLVERELFGGNRAAG